MSTFRLNKTITTMTNSEGLKSYLMSDDCLSSTSITLQEGESAYVFNSGASTNAFNNISLKMLVADANL